jgi:hypothetical protein
MAEKEKKEVAQAVPYNPGEMFKLSCEEQVVYDCLSTEEQVVFDLYRQSFALASGEIGTQGEILAAAITLASSEVINVFAQLALFPSTAFTNAESYPDFLKVISAPKKHRAAGKKYTNAEKDQEYRLSELGKPWWAWSDILKQYFMSDEDHKARLKGALVAFLIRDDTFLNPEEERRRVTGNMAQASFFREYVVSRKNDELLHPVLVELLSHWRVLIQPYLIYERVVFPNPDEEQLEAFENWFFLRYNSNSVKQQQALKNPPTAVKQFRHFFKRYPTLEDKQMIDGLVWLRMHWEGQHPGQEF